MGASEHQSKSRWSKVKSKLKFSKKSDRSGASSSVPEVTATTQEMPATSTPSTNEPPTVEPRVVATSEASSPKATPPKATPPTVEASRDEPSEAKSPPFGHRVIASKVDAPRAVEPPKVGPSNVAPPRVTEPEVVPSKAAPPTIASSTVRASEPIDVVVASEVVAKVSTVRLHPSRTVHAQQASKGPEVQSKEIQPPNTPDSKTSDITAQDEPVPVSQLDPSLGLHAKSTSAPAVEESKSNSDLVNLKSHETVQQTTISMTNTVTDVKAVSIDSPAKEVAKVAITTETSTVTSISRSTTEPSSQKPVEIKEETTFKIPPRPATFRVPRYSSAQSSSFRNTGYAAYEAFMKPNEDLYTWSYDPPAPPGTSDRGNNASKYQSVMDKKQARSKECARCLGRLGEDGDGCKCYSVGMAGGYETTGYYWR
jgi:hypothetical protein